MDTARLEKLIQTIRQGFASQDPKVEVRGQVRGNGQLDLTVISALFANRDSREREEIFWPALNDIPPEERVYMTYCLLLSPDEADRYFNAVTEQGEGAL